MKRTLPTNQEKWPNVFPYMALYWANVLAIVPPLGQFSWFVGLESNYMAKMDKIVVLKAKCLYAIATEYLGISLNVNN